VQILPEDSVGRLPRYEVRRKALPRDRPMHGAA
jgi:hypothetical protein